MSADVGCHSALQGLSCILCMTPTPHLIGGYGELATNLACDWAVEVRYELESAVWRSDLIPVLAQLLCAKLAAKDAAVQPLLSYQGLTHVW